MVELSPCAPAGGADACALPAPPARPGSRISLFLDFDGTLVELAEAPDRVVVGQPLPGLLSRLDDALEGRIALLTGRGADMVAALLGDISFPVAGSHGAELRIAGDLVSPPRPAQLDEVLAAMQRFAAERPGLLVESKPLGVALHYRQRPQDEEACLDLAKALAAPLGLHVQTGKMVAELRAAGANKGSALRALMDRDEMRGSCPLFLGDDATDEPGFLAAADLGGAGVLVGPARATAARYRLDSVAAVHAWLEGLAGA